MTKRKALGKGLSALIPDAGRLDNGKTRFFNCPVEAIEPNPYQPRQDFSEAEMVGMVQSVREKGILTPLLVSRLETGYQLIAGERRWRAAQRAGLTHVPVVVREVRDTESLELALIENIHRKDLNAIEEARAYKRLIDETGATQDAVAKMLGKDRSTITNLLRLLNLSLPIQKHVIDGRLSVGHARVLAGLKSESDRHRLSRLILEKGLSGRQAEAMGKKMTSPPRPKKKEAELDYYLKSLSDTLKRSLDEELDRLLEVLG